jgi:biopolymer transport protein ExbD
MPIAQKAYSLILIVLGTVLGVTAQIGAPNEQLIDPEPIVVSVGIKGTFKLGDKPMTLARLGTALGTAFEERTPPDRTVYIKAAAAVPFSQISKVLKLGRSLDQDSFAFMLDDGRADGMSGAVITKDSPEATVSEENVKPNPLYLALSFTKSGGMKLNGEAHTLNSLRTQLSKIFKDREDNGVFAEGSNDVEKTVFLVPTATTNFRAIVRGAQALRDAGADPIGLEIDGPQPLVISTLKAR